MAVHAPGTQRPKRKFGLIELRTVDACVIRASDLATDQFVGSSDKVSARETGMVSPHALPLHFATISIGQFNNAG